MNFIPVLLGSDMNVYGMARSFHEQYGMHSIAFGRMVLPATRYSKIVTVNPIPKLEDEAVFLKTLMEFAANNKEKELLLIACGDTYLELVIKNKEKLIQYFHVPSVDQSLMDLLESKESFYKICDKYQLDYPKTLIVSKDDYDRIEVPFEYPVILKPSNSAMYWKVSFEGKKKAFKADNPGEMKNILHAVYHSDYTDHFIIQEFIPGDDSSMRVMNNYSTKDGKVVMQSLGHVLLEEHSPQGIGSHAAIIGIRDVQLEAKVKDFLEDIGYVGYSNFDIKYDERNGSYKFFEINLRQGRSSFYTTASGCNLAKYLAEDYVSGKKASYETIEPGFLWHVVPIGLIKKYVPHKEIIDQVNEILKQGKNVNSLMYKKDPGLKRWLRQLKDYYAYYKKYTMHFGKKGLG
ncbi:MAG TPA: hypothetical protein ACFCUD_13585 [Cyclobacteriaceae bacterium]